MRGQSCSTCKSKVYYWPPPTQGGKGISEQTKRMAGGLTEGQIILTAKPAGPPFRPAVGKVEDLSPYPGLGTARSDDTTTNKHRTSTQH